MLGEILHTGQLNKNSMSLVPFVGAGLFLCPEMPGLFCMRFLPDYTERREADAYKKV